MAWGLSALGSDSDGKFIGGIEGSYWDLWMMWSSEVPNGWETLSTDGSGRPTEYRVYDRIRKSKIWYVGTRLHRPKKERIRNRYR